MKSKIIRIIQKLKINAQTEKQNYLNCQIYLQNFIGKNYHFYHLFSITVRFYRFKCVRNRIAECRIDTLSHHNIFCCRCMSQYRLPERLEILQRKCHRDPIGVSGRKHMQSHSDCDTKVKSKSLSQFSNNIEILRETCHQRSVK